jgi:hypothetical protein
MSHRHFCDFGAGHYYECEGIAIRLFDRAATTCMCPDHGTPIEQGDHGECSVERISCPLHRHEQLLSLGYDPCDPPDPSSLLAVLDLFTDKEDHPLVGWCHWCLGVFRSLNDFENHMDDLWNNCPAFEELRNNKLVVEFLDAMDEFDFPDEESEE